MYDLCRELASLLARAKSLAAPYEAQIQALEIAKADALAGLTFQIDTLKAALRPQLLALGETIRCEGLTASVVHKEVWDPAQLRAFAEEVPAVRQCCQDGSYVTFRFQPLSKKEPSP